MVSNNSVPEEDITQSHKGSKVKSYTMEFKLAAIQKAEQFSIRHAAEFFHVDRKRIRKWRKDKDKIVQMSNQVAGKKRKALDGAGRNPKSEEMEDIVFEWVTDRRSKRLRVSRKLVMKKAKIIYDELEGTDKAEKFEATKGWLEKFMRRTGLSMRRRTSVAQKDPNQLINKIVCYHIQVRRLQSKFDFLPSNIYAMDETPVWEDMVATTTVDRKGTKDVVMQSTGHEKARVTVCLTDKADGSKLKPFIVFKGAKRECVKLNDEFRGRCVVVSSENGWMNTPLTLEYNRMVLGSLSFSTRLLAWDSYEAHIESTVSKDIKHKNFECYHTRWLH